MERLFSLLFVLFGCIALTAQMPHQDYIGGGHSNGVSVTTSSSANNTSGEKTIDGFPIQNDDQLKDASRFLAQCTFGADWNTIEMTAAMGYEAWLDEQFALPQVSMLNEAAAQSLFDDDLEGGQFGANLFENAWMTNNLTSPDILRDRIAFILSEIFVINNGSDLFADFGQLSCAYYDELGKNAFTDYQTLLTDVTLSPAMGLFLSHYSNPKANSAANIHPDENYAREIMQLFSIGLWELNPNGTRKYDANGQFIPTYTNDNIKEFAQVFTGLSAGSPNGVWGDIEESNDFLTAMISPMAMYESYHDNSSKMLLNGTVLPAGQSGMQDINQTIAHLASHPNTAPFISQSLIKFLTTSNPSPQYVADVAGVFNPGAANNMQDVIRTILLHPEARNCTPTPHYSFGKLREPFVRHMNYLKAFQMSPNPNGDYFTEYECLTQLMGQTPLNAPSVFNFFLPEYQPQGPIGQNYYYAPEFQLMNAANSIGLVNDANNIAVHRVYLNEACDSEPYNEEEDGEDIYEYVMDYSRAMALAGSPSELLNHLDILLANGLLQANTKSIITNAVSQLSDNKDRIKMATYLILISPDYAILR